MATNPFTHNTTLDGDISPQDLLHLLENKSTFHLHLIDVRRPDEFIEGHIPGARLFTLDTLPQHIFELPKDELVVFVCHSGYRSAQACAFALENGFQQVRNLQGGMTLWNELNLKQEGEGS